jgi:hypothetical protein
MALTSQEAQRKEGKRRATIDKASLSAELAKKNANSASLDWHWHEEMTGGACLSKSVDISFAMFKQLAARLPFPFLLACVVGDGGRVSHLFEVCEGLCDALLRSAGMCGKQD